MNFAITWLFDKLGYMPKIKIDAGVVEVWPFPVPSEPAKDKKPTVAKATTRKTKVPTKKPVTTRKPKAK